MMTPCSAPRKTPQFRIRIRQLINFLLIIFGYLWSRFTGHALHFGMPVAASIEPINRCNLRCPECPAGTGTLSRPAGKIEPEMFRTILDQLSPELIWLTLYFQGEPFLHSHLFDFISQARQRGIYVITSTNGHFLNEDTVRQTILSGLNRLIISVDGYDQESYEKYRVGGSYEKVLSGIRQLVSEKKRLKRDSPVLEWQSLVLRHNEDHLDEIRRTAKSLGVDKVTFKTAQFNDPGETSQMMPVNPRYNRYKPSDGSSRNYRLKHALPDHCFRLWSSVVITWDGLVVPCCYDKDARYPFGDLKTNQFRKIWRDEPARNFRAKILEARKSIDICSNCAQTF